MEGINAGPDNDNDSTSGSDTTIPFLRIGGRWPPQQTHTQQPSQVNSTYERNTQLTSMSRGQRRSTSRRLCLHRMGLQNLSLALQTQPASTPTPAEPFGEVIHQYMDTLCTSQRQTHLTNSQIEDITVFNDHDLSKLEEWLTDVEMAADLTNESGA